MKRKFTCPNCGNTKAINFFIICGEDRTSAESNPHDTTQKLPLDVSCTICKFMGNSTIFVAD